MTSYADARNFILTTDTNSNKNLSSGLYQFSSASTSVGVGTYKTRTYTVPLSKTTRFYQMYVNLSLDGGTYVAIPNRDRFYNSNKRQIATTISQNGANITLTLYLINADSSSQTFPAFDINVYRRDFEDEI